MSKIVSKRLKNSTNLEISVHIFNSKAGLTKVRTDCSYLWIATWTHKSGMRNILCTCITTYYVHICMQYTERNSLNKNRIYSFTRHRQHLCGYNIVLWTLLFTMNTVLALLGAVHKLCRLKIDDFWPPPP